MLKNTAAAILMLLCSVQLHSQNVWIRQNIQTNENLLKVFFADSLNGWITGDSALILYTSNGGNDFIRQYKNSQDYINDIFFLNNNTGWAVIWRSNGAFVRSIILSTTNSGVNWTQNIFLDTNTILSSIYFLNQNTGFAGCFNSQTKIIQKTTDGGRVWHSVEMDSVFVSNFPVRVIKFIDANTGFAAGGYYDMCGVLWKTTNGGDFWSTQSIGSEPLNSISFPDSNTVIISGGDYEFGISTSISTDRGIHWDYKLTGNFGIGYSVSFRTQNEGWISSGFSQIFLHTTDKGSNWNILNTPDSSAIYSVCFPNSVTGWAVGSGGAVLKYIAKPIYAGSSGEIISNDMLSGAVVYPNPFNSSSRVKYYIRRNAVLDCRLFNIQGREILSKKINSTAGYNYLSIDLSGYAAGIYFLNLSEPGSGEKSLIKLIYLK